MSLLSIDVSLSGEVNEGIFTCIHGTCNAGKITTGHFSCVIPRFEGRGLRGFPLPRVVLLATWTSSYDGLQAELGLINAAHARGYVPRLFCDPRVSVSAELGPDKRSESALLAFQST